MRFIMPKFFFGCERWKWNADLRLYVSTQGHFKDEYKRNKVCKVKNNYFWIHANNKWLPAHRVVLLTWRPLPVDGEPMTVDHLNSITRDNRLCNLEWVSEEENHRRAQENQLVEESSSTTTKVSKKKPPILPIDEPLLCSNLGFNVGDAFILDFIVKNVINENILFRVNNQFYTAKEYYKAFNHSKSVKMIKVIRRACSAAVRGAKYNNLQAELIQVR